jgi:SET domain-containing protein
MILVKTKIGPSKIHGTGLFADEFIPKGTLSWRFDKSVDESFTKEEVERLPEPKRSEILGLYHAYINKHTGHYINCGDSACFVNHADAPNWTSEFDGDASRDEDEIAVAARDIYPGEEITNDYRVLAAEGIDFPIVN